ncbi:MAG TPA: hypothetical protein VM008_10900 [Phycisphaerae bacterium]|nr:hypothetical protein [Phycisphaerae bacterium]
MQDSIPDRYEKNPMLVVLENYVLDALGLLEAEKAAKLNEMICRTFGGKDWKQTVRQQFALPADTDATLRQLWKARQEEAEVKQEELVPEDFARVVVDEMFAGLGGAGDEEGD